ncbi:condensation domain-containing protein [Solwaraspora sp. WMMD1047]|uniref:condensation domain-containing protein n=1 Tax=Solwaraspora sp. WMMD1047 TaxID=3016102 RepID=UPI0024166488|nr:condensation domain-containing protein [Solwaraspora sp. WMMD1047]MDG4830670.1 condensation domain-containing protein [Solwaraspora sp. WMMD1047]
MDGRELSVGQEALWFLYQLAPESSAYNVSAAANLHFPVDLAALSAAVSRTVAGNSLLNSVIRTVAGDPRRCPGGAGTTLQVHELPGDDGAVRDFARSWAQRPFQLDRQPPIRVALLRRDGATPDLLLMAGHHIAMDNASQLLIMREILDQYAARVAGTDRPVVDTGADFDLFVRREREFLGSARAAAASAHWRRELTGVGRGIGVPVDLPRPAVYRFVGAEIGGAFPADLLARVEAACAARNVTPFAYLLSVFQLLLHTVSGETDFVVGYNVSVRPGRRFREAVGYFVNTLPMPARVEPQGSFGALLRRTKERLWPGLIHRDYPFALMPRLVEVRRDPSRAGLISTLFVMGADDPADPFFGIVVPGHRVERAGLTVSQFDVPQQLGQFDLTLQVLRHAPIGRAELKLKYNTSLFTADTARRLADGYLRLLRAAADGTLPSRLDQIDI